MKRFYYKIKRIKQISYHCGPTALAQLLDFYGCSNKINEIIKKTKIIKNLGTYDGFLGKAAIEMGFKVNILTQNLYVFDPTWYNLSNNKLIKKLKLLKKTVKKKKLNACINGYIKFLKAGGKLEFKPITKELLISKLIKHPILIGLCMTYLYMEKRTNNKRTKRTDLDIFRIGHFVIVNGYDPKTDKFYITDTNYEIPFSKTGKYKISPEILINAMLLGEATYDCTILEIS